MKNLSKICALFFIGVALTSCDRVAPNYIGVLMEDYGKSKSDYHLQKGRVWTASPGTELFQVPMWEQRALLEKPTLVEASDKTLFTCAPKYSYKVIEDRAVDLVFQNSRLGSGEDFMKALEDNVLEPAIYDVVNDQSRTYSVEELMGVGGSSKFEAKVQFKVDSLFKAYGLKLQTFTAKLTPSKQVSDKINDRNQVTANVSVLDQKIIEQRKKNELTELQAQELIIRSKGLTPQVLQEMALEKWNGALPATYSGGPLPLFKPVN